MNLKKTFTKLFEDFPKDIIGVDIGSGNVKLVQVNINGKRPIVTAALSAELPVDMINNGFIRMAAQMTSFIKKLIDSHGFTSKYVVFSIGGRNAFVREITVPPMPDNEMRQAAIWDAGQYVPYEANSYYTDAAKFGTLDPDGQQPMLLVAAPKELVDTMLEIGDNMGWTTLAIDIEVLSCYRMFTKQYTDFVLLDIGRGYSLITIFQGGAPVAQRSIPHGSQMFDSAIADSCGCSLEEAETKKMNENFLESADPAVKEKYKAVFEAVDNMDREVNRTCEYYRLNKKNAVFTDLVLTGGGASVPGLVEYLRHDEDKLNVSLLDIRARVDFSSKIPKEQRKKLAATCAVAIGAALAGGETND